MTTEHTCSHIDCNCIEIVTVCISLHFLGLYLYCHRLNVLIPEFSSGLQLMSSLSNNCHWALLIDITTEYVDDITIFKLIEPTYHNLDFYNGVEHDTRQQTLFI